MFPSPHSLSSCGGMSTFPPEKDAPRSALGHTNTPTCFPELHCQNATKRLKTQLWTHGAHYAKVLNMAFVQAPPKLTCSKHTICLPSCFIRPRWCPEFRFECLIAHHSKTNIKFLLTLLWFFGTNEKCSQWANHLLNLGKPKSVPIGTLRCPSSCLGQNLETLTGQAATIVT